jgi:hypothetical protein
MCPEGFLAPDFAGWRCGHSNNILPFKIQKSRMNQSVHTAFSAKC